MEAMQMRWIPGEGYGDSENSGRHLAYGKELLMGTCTWRTQGVMPLLWFLVTPGCELRGHFWQIWGILECSGDQAWVSAMLYLL